MRKTLIMAIVLGLIAVAVYAGGQPEAPEVGVGTEDVLYISPEESPGTQDELSIPITVGEIGGNNVVVSYRLEVRNANDQVVWVESGVDESEQPGFFGRLLQNLGLQQRQTTVTIPEATTWNGTFQDSDVGSDGAPVPDGEYTYVLTVTDNRDVTATSEPRTVVVDNTAPQASASVDHDVFSPDGDGNRETVTLMQETSSEDEWVGRITNASGDVIFEVTWAGEAVEQFTWNGRNLADTEVDDGEYTYTLTATDRAGNTGSIDPITVVVDTAPRPLDLVPSTTAFSPNGDGSRDVVELTFGDASTLRLESAVIRVEDASGRDVGSVEVGDQIADSVVLTGYLDQERTRRAPEGTYEVSVTATYGNGTVSTAGPVSITLDVTPPSGSVRATDSLFSPDGDGLEDTTRIIHDLSDDASWTGYVYEPGGEVFQTLQLGTDVPSAVVWDGTDLDGNPVPDGTYSYSLIGTDPAGNQFETNEIRVGVDRRPTPLDLTVDREYFSPNGDGQGDVVIVTPQIGLRANIASYRFRLVDGDGNEIMSGEADGAPPLSIPWDGRTMDGELLSEGEYVGVLELVYEKGNRPRALTPVVTIDNTIPQVALRASSTRITPDGDGEDDAITFIPIVDPAREIARYVGRIESLDGQVVAEITGEQPIGTAFWDGTTMTGATAPDGAYVATLEVEHRNGTIRSAQSNVIALGTSDDQEAPRVALQLNPQIFSPDGDGRADEVSIVLAITDQSAIARWAVSIVDPDGNVFYEYTERGEPVRSFTWDGLNDAGERVTMATDYEVRYEVTDAQGNTATGSSTLTVDILTVERFGMRKIDLPDIIFEGYTTRYLNWNKDLSEQNVRVLDQIAAALEKFPEYDIELHGHAVSVLYYDEELSDLEHEQTLIPLSRGRSETIEEAMADRGIDAGRFSREWWGKLRPLVPFSNLEDRFINRRVEFYLVR